MRPGRPSTTATWVAALRGLGGARRDAIVDDPIAERLLPQPYRALVAAARRAPGAMTAIHRLADAWTEGRARHMAFRTRAIDDAIGVAVARGARQLVILGAGLDARAWRLDGLDDVVVYEVDHPSTQAYKRERVRALPARARAVRFVSVDFGRDRLDDALAAAGHDAAIPTVLVWEGVTMYLPVAAIEATLAAVARRSAARSTLLTTYFVAGASAPDTRALLRLVALVGEPIVTRFDPESFAALAAAHGFSRTADEGDPEWAARYLGRTERWTLERLLVATRG